MRGRDGLRVLVRAHRIVYFTPMKPAESPSALKVQATLGEKFEVMEFDANTRTAADAATAIGWRWPRSPSR